jgi:predicted ATPase/class 3 adenylate cyclase
MESLPAGTLTLMLTDIEGSSSRWEANVAVMRAAMVAHDEIVRDIVAVYGGSIVKHLGDGCWAVFTSAPRAAEAAVELLRRMQSEPWEFGERLDIRVGLHTGVVEPTDDDYFGPVPNRAARIVDLANGNQIVCSVATAGLLPGVSIRNAGPHELRGIGVEEICMIVGGGYEADDRPLRQALVPSNLPRTRTSFVGRSITAVEVARCLREEHSVVTLVGPGGIGKTRLAVEVGATLQRGAHEKVHFCDLAAVADPDAIADAVAEAVGARRQPGMNLVDSIIDYLTGREVILILDNCEHVIDAARDLIDRLQGTETLRLLATSREALRIPGEQLVVVEPLPPETIGVDLFVQRVRERDPHFEMSAADRDDVHDLIRRVDGIPLAIELAAGWARVMTPAEMLDRLGDDARLLHDAQRGTRHITLNDTVAWSYNLLPPAEATLFDRMSVFSGGCTLNAVETVCAGDSAVPVNELPALIMALVDKSMVVSRPDGPQRRFSMLETLRTFGRAQLGESGSADRYLRRHADYFREFAVAQNCRLLTPAEPDAWHVLDREWANLRAALDSFESDDAIHDGAELVTALVWYASLSMRFELFSWAEELLAAPGIEADSAYVDLCGAAAIGAYFTVDPRVTELAGAGLAANPSDPGGFCRTALAAVLLNNLHAAADSDELTSAWLATLPTEPGNKLWSEAFRTFSLSANGLPAEAAAHSAATAAIAVETGSGTAAALAAWAEGQVVTFEDPERAVAVWTDGLEWPRSLPGDHLVEHLLTGLILHFIVRHGDLVSTLRQCRDAVQRALDHHYVAGTSHLFGVSAIALCRAGDADIGARLVGAMIDNGHLPRSNARRALEVAFGTRDLEPYLATGTGLGITAAANIAIDALNAATERVGTEEPSNVVT